MSVPACDHRVPVLLGDRSYEILIQAGLLGQLGDICQALGLSGRIAIITNPIIHELYGPMVQRVLKRTGFACTTVLLPDGERAKSMTWLGKILDELAAKRFERRDAILALGGGVVGDVAGFAAASYLRGVPFVQVPTTLVAQVDSSVGGKTGVNHPLGKNLIGAFYQPKAVVIDPHVLHTLPKREWVAGLAEVIKYGVIADRDFFEFLENHVEELRSQNETVIPGMVRRCCEIKAEVVAGDEREAGRRKILNYGHTVGHALEAWGKYSTWVHGEAVGIGMVQEASIGQFLGRCDGEVVERQTELIREVGLPVAMPKWAFSDLWTGMQHDKKVVKGQINCVIPERLGQVQVLPLNRSDLQKWFSQTTLPYKRRVAGSRKRVLQPRPSKKK
ncbi:MAG: 3-dehydroquinate synthase [Nitrospirales bacterium]